MVLGGLMIVFLALTAGFLSNTWGHPPKLVPIPLVDPTFLQTNTVRESYAELVRKEADVSDFACYACHDKEKPPVLKFDADQNLVIPKEHEDVKMSHGSHNRNNNCYNCHDEHDLEKLQTRDGHSVDFAESPRLCGSCHGPTYRDWEAGAHGRSSGNWNRVEGQFKRQACVDCHNPHSPKFPSRKPAPGPHHLHGSANASATPQH
jgi:formate-dependent nitrite reductase cytochrome c552 subunit